MKKDIVLSTSVSSNRGTVTPYQHQITGIEHLVEHPVFALFDEMGLGKTLQVIYAAQLLYEQNLIDRVIVITPASVRAVWYDPDLGELAKHLWPETPARVAEYHARIRSWLHGPTDVSARTMKWTITNYDFVRLKKRREVLLKVCNERTMLVLDESSLVKNWRSIQTKACLELRRKCGRIVLLNGTPIAHNPMDLFAQGNLLSPQILDCKYLIQYRSRYAVMGGYMAQTRFGKRAVQIVGWKNLDDLQQRFAPYVLRRTKDQCLDLPPKLESVALTATLTPKTWALYTSMRDEMVAWLTDTSVSLAPHAAVKSMRLSQITSGFLGGILDDWVETDHVEVIGREKTDTFFEWLDIQLGLVDNLKLLVWCRFRAELFRLQSWISGTYPRISYGAIYGGQTADERKHALELLDPRTTPNTPVLVAGTPAAGSMGLNLTAASTVVYLSNDYNLKTREQSEDRVHRPGQTRPVSYFDVVAVGPKGQKTIDHVILKALKNKLDVAQWTTSAWIRALQEE